VFEGYNGSIDNWAYYVRHYAEKKVRKNLFERYVANSLGAIARAEKSYDEIVTNFEDKLSGKKQRSATEIKEDLITKFNKESK
jgi:hypothetical protein